eukprot:Nk52_evm41s96 gene=Nk52_evmTU41s96
MSGMEVVNGNGGFGRSSSTVEMEDKRDLNRKTSNESDGSSESYNETITPYILKEKAASLYLTHPKSSNSIDRKRAQLLMLIQQGLEYGESEESLVNHWKSDSSFENRSSDRREEKLSAESFYNQLFSVKSSEAASPKADSVQGGISLGECRAREGENKSANVRRADTDEKSGDGSVTIREAFLESYNQHFRVLCDCKSVLKAAAKGRVDLIKKIVQSRNGDIDMNCKTSARRFTPLHYACLYNRVEVVKYLLDECQVKTHVLDKQGCSPFHYAMKKGHHEICELIRSAEAKQMNEIDEALGPKVPTDFLFIHCRGSETVNNLFWSYTEYLIEVRTFSEKYQWNTFVVQKRFSDFEELHERIFLYVSHPQNRTKIHNFELKKQFPEKHFFGRFSEDVIRARRCFFEHLLLEVSKHDALRDILVDFLCH